MVFLLKFKRGKRKKNLGKYGSTASLHTTVSDLYDIEVTKDQICAVRLWEFISDTFEYKMLNFEGKWKTRFS